MKTAKKNIWQKIVLAGMAALFVSLSSADLTASAQAADSAQTSGQTYYHCDNYDRDGGHHGCW